MGVVRGTFLFLWNAQGGHFVMVMRGSEGCELVATLTPYCCFDPGTGCIMNWSIGLTGLRSGELLLGLKSYSVSTWGYKYLVFDVIVYSDLRRAFDDGQLSFYFWRLDNFKV